MPINPDLLVAAPMLQDYFVDKTTGDPLAGGQVTFYKDIARTVLKNVYYQVGTPGHYTYIPFTNPIILSASGTIADNNGNDVIPYYYPYNEDDSSTIETYYVTVYSSNPDGSQAVLQFTRENFPLTIGQNAENTISTNKNYVINKEFWRNIGSQSITSTDTVVAPSAHEGFSMPDIRYQRNANNAVETVSFYQFVPPGNPVPPQNFTDQILGGDTTPEFYFNLNCTGAGSETEKFLQFPLSLHIKSLSGAVGNITFQGMNVAGNAHNQVTVSILQFLGTGSGSNLLTYSIINLTPGWKKYTIPVLTPTAQNVITSGTGDDALYIRFGFQPGETCNINIAMPSFYLGTIPPTNDFDTYDQISAITSSPRTGDFRISLNSFFPFGWVPANDGTIGSASSLATIRRNIDTWPLFSLLWNNFSDANAPVSGGRGGSAVADWNANKTIRLTLTLGRVIAGTQPGSGVGGLAFGSATHTMTVAEMPNHDHPGSLAHVFDAAVEVAVVTPIAVYTPIAVSAIDIPLDIEPQGGGGAFSIDQLSVYQNIFLKL